MRYASAWRTLTIFVTGATWLFLFMLGPASAYAAITHDWPADGDATDTVGDADGTLVGGTSFGPGLFNQGFVFDGVDDAVTFGTSAGKFGTSDFTIAFVIQSTNTSSIEGVLGKREICGFSSFWDVRSSSSGTLSLELYENNVNTGLATTSRVNDGLFHTVIFTREETVVSAYVDGFLKWQTDTGITANVSNNAALTAPDALAILQRAVSLPVTSLCPLCPVEL